MMDVQRKLQAILTPPDGAATRAGIRKARPDADGSVLFAEGLLSAGNRSEPHEAKPAAEKPEPARISGGITLEAALITAEAARRLLAKEPVGAEPVDSEPTPIDGPPIAGHPVKILDTGVAIDPPASEIPGPTILPENPIDGVETEPEPDPEPAPEAAAPAPGSKMLGTRAEYMLDGATGKGSTYQGLAVRYWDVYSDGTKVLREDWSNWTGTVDSSLANTDLDGGNVVALSFGSRPPISV